MEKTAHMRWIKASERLPQRKAIIRWKSIIHGEYEVAIKNAEWLKTYMVYDKDAEWLDESTPPSEQVTDSQVEDKREEKIREFVEAVDRAGTPSGTRGLKAPAAEREGEKTAQQFAQTVFDRHYKKGTSYGFHSYGVVLDAMTSYADYKLAAKEKEIANLTGSISVMVEQADDFRDQISKRDKEIAKLKGELKDDSDISLPILASWMATGFQNNDYRSMWEIWEKWAAPKLQKMYGTIYTQSQRVKESEEEVAQLNVQAKETLKLYEYMNRQIEKYQKELAEAHETISSLHRRGD